LPVALRKKTPGRAAEVATHESAPAPKAANPAPMPVTPTESTVALIADHAAAPNNPTQ